MSLARDWTAVCLSQHSVEIARAAGIDLWREVITEAEFNDLSRRVPVVADVKPFGRFYMEDVEDRGGLQVVVKDLLEAGFLEGSCLTCTGETLTTSTVVQPTLRPTRTCCIR